MLKINNHDRNAAGLTYIYPVHSRRSGGLSIGINLNPNNACNWRCIYCQVPYLSRGNSPKINLSQLKNELEYFLDNVISGNFFAAQAIPENLRTIKDIAFSGNGEPTTAEQFAEIINIVSEVRNNFKLGKNVKTVLISNGSKMLKKNVRTGLRSLAAVNGEVWFKIDSVLPESIMKINNVSLSTKQILNRLQSSTQCCPTWIQSCFFKFQEQVPTEKEVDAYLKFIGQIIDADIPIKGIHLYTIARPSHQPESNRLSAIEKSWLLALQKKILTRNIQVCISI